VLSLKKKNSIGGSAMPLPRVEERNLYEQPILRKLTSEQAVLFLVGHAYIGHRGARVLLELLFPITTDSSGHAAKP
jgi:hypothetical protein